NTLQLLTPLVKRLFQSALAREHQQIKDVKEHWRRRRTPVILQQIKGRLAFWIERDNFSVHNRLVRKLPKRACNLAITSGKVFVIPRPKRYLAIVFERDSSVSV